MSRNFETTLAEGLLGEGLIAKWFNRRGWNVLPAYQVEHDTGKGPRLFMSTSHQLITPDLLVFNTTRVMWVEAKTKSAFTWHRISGSWQTGIDRKHWHHYLEVGRQTPWDVWLLFLHKAGHVAKDTPTGKKCPSGLYGGDIKRLETCVDHEHANWGATGMVYWREESLTRICGYEDVVAASHTSTVPVQYVASSTPAAGVMA